MQPSAVAKLAEKSQTQDGLEQGGVSALCMQSRALLGPLLVFALTLVLALWQHFAGSELRCTFFSDSRHYLETCRQIVLYLNNLSVGAPLGLALHLAPGQALSACLMMDGPVLPLMPAIIFLLLGKVPTQVDWQQFVVLESLLHALCAAFVFVLMARLTNSRKWAFGAGMFWGLYPPAIIASGRFLTEIPAALFLLVLVWSGCRLAENPTDRPISLYGKSIGLGFWNGIILLLKPALVPAWLGVNAVALAFSGGWKLRMQVVAAVLAGLCLVVVPWALLSKAMTGKVYLTPQRAPVYNIAKGCDTESDGWGALPDDMLTAYLSNSPDVWTVMRIAFREHPVELLNMSLRKVVRLWSVPWNDFRVSVFGLPAGWQQWCQWLLLILTAPGALAVLCGVPARLVPAASRRAAEIVGFASIVVVLGHLAYVPFEAISRYGFTSMPFVVLLAVYGLHVVWRMPSQRQKTLLLIGALLALTLVIEYVGVANFVAITGDFRLALLAKLACESLFIIGALVAAFAYIESGAAESRFKLLARSGAFFACFGLFAIAVAFCLDGRAEREWSCTLGPGQSVCRQLNLASVPPAFRKEPAVAAVLIDADSSCKSAIVSVNGHRLAAAPESLLRFRPEHYFLFDIMRTFAAKLGMPVDEIRQWRAVLVPVRFLNRGGPNELRLVNAGNLPVTIYGDYRDRWAQRCHIPAFNYFSAAFYCNSIEGLEGRILDAVGLPRVSSSCWLEHKGRRDDSDLSPAVGRQTGQYRLYLLLDYSRRQDDTAGPPGKPTEKYSIPLSARNFDPQLGNTLMTGADLRINKAILKTAARLDSQIAIPEAALAAPKLRIRITGALRAARQSCTASVLPILIGGGAQPYSMVLAATPPCFNAGPDWSRFEISDIVPPDKFSGGLKYVSIALFPGRWEEVWEYGCDRRAGDACFRDLKIEFEPVFEPSLDAERPIIY